MRLTGLSGFDTETMIRDLMNANRAPMNKLLQEKTYTEWQRDDYRSFNRKLNDFSTSLFDGVMRASTYTSKTVTTSSSAVAVRSVSATTDFSGELKVNQLAEAASIRSSAGVTIDPKAKLDTVLGNNDPQTIRVQTIKADGTLDPAGFELTFNPANETLETVMSKISRGANVDMFYDSFTGKVAINARQSGDVAGDAEIKLTGDFLTNTLNLVADNIAAGVNGTQGKNAKFVFNGLETERLSNKFTIQGFEFTLNQTTTDSVRFSSSPDVDKILTTVAKFVEDYNKLIGEIKDKTSEQKFRGFPPLTDEQRSELSEKEAELWDEKAMSGTLRGDSFLNSALTSFRQDLSAPVNGLNGINSLAEIGITTTSNFRDGGKLVVDEAKLREAIASDPGQIQQLFAKTGATEADKGLAVRLREQITVTRNQIIERAGRDTSVANSFTLGRNINNIEDQITNFERRLQQMETRYYKQFGAMETALQRANSQSAYLMNAFGGF